MISVRLYDFVKIYYKKVIFQSVILVILNKSVVEVLLLKTLKDIDAWPTESTKKSIFWGYESTKPGRNLPIPLPMVCFNIAHFGFHIYSAGLLIPCGFLL